MGPESRAILHLVEEVEKCTEVCPWCGVRGHGYDECEDLTLYIHRKIETQCGRLKRIRRYFFWAGIACGMFWREAIWFVVRYWK
jgi:hypothetical protein